MQIIGMGSETIVKNVALETDRWQRLADCATLEMWYTRKSIGSAKLPLSAMCPSGTYAIDNRAQHRG